MKMEAADLHEMSLAGLAVTGQQRAMTPDLSAGEPKSDLTPATNNTQ